MKITVDRSQFADAVTTAAKALAPRPSVPVMAGLLLRAAAGQLTVAGYDYDVSNEITMDATVDADGSALVSGRLLAEIVKALPAKPVTMAAVGAHLELVCGSARFTLPTMPVEDYPSLPALPGVIGAIDTAVLAQAITRTAVAAGRDETLPMMTGVRMEFRGDTLSLLATDRYRLAHLDITFQPASPDLSLDLLVPSRALADTAKTWTSSTIEIAATAGGELIGFTDGRRKTTSRLLDGANYPPVRSLFPKNADIKAGAVVAAADLIEVVKRVSLVSERSTPVLLNFTGGGLVVEAGGAEDARASENLDGVTYHGDPLTIGFNPQYLIDGLHHLGTRAARFSFVDAIKPAVITPADDNSGPVDGHRYLIMPIRAVR